MDESHPNPGRLQATFLPAQASLAWWGVHDVEAALAAHGVPVGSPSDIRLAVPVGAGEIAPRTVRTRTVELAAALPALRDLRPTLDNRNIGASVWSWWRAVQLAENDSGFAGVVATMPTAAHAALDADETSIETAESVLRRFIAMVTLTEELRIVGVRATLRPYQLLGLSWLTGLSSEGGGVLADEMGLGKTLQAISLLAVRAAEGPHLVVCPTSVIENWRRELARFAPDLRVTVHHGVNRSLPTGLGVGSVILTSYNVLRSDVDTLAAAHWNAVVFDEAQQIKNPNSLGARAGARLPARLKVAMTGTPVENRLDELWSLLHVTNPGVLGTRARFRQRFATPIESGRSTSAAARLSAVISPYVLRRTKAAVATDLPPKQYSTIVCTLTDEQTRLYREAVEAAFSSGLGSGIARRGNVLALLTTLKQVCNHPAQLKRDDNGLSGRSGKFDRATEMLAEIVEDGDRALVFTQYRTMGTLLSSHLTAQLGVGTVPFLHGGLTVARRTELVETFQSASDASPVLILSLRAAGFGLNLTRANHVVHYDRWWNPAVEDQATDRVHRIGQHRTVNVHTLVTGGTIEDHIAAMHKSKRAVAESIAGGSEAALADLSDAELRAIVDLDARGTL
ncbi:DEAD/DEAH box helicase [Prescottella agglutinans]|uniref:DEAD/DEAH box helicase n=1 Tax=Prescottella agglutinans TaxID=1644129 RepID=UPI003D97FB9C